jgi:hypothetical protein
MNASFSISTRSLASDNRAQEVGDFTRDFARPGHGRDVAGSV